METWNKVIRVESDFTTGRTIGAGTAVYTRTVDNNALIPESEFRYIDVQATNPSSQPTVTFELPDVLSGFYNIYVEFLPGTMYARPSANDSTKIMFTLTYTNANGRPTSRDVLTNNLVTSGTKKVKMLVLSNFEFPTSNYYDKLWMVDYLAGNHRIEDIVVNTKLLIRTNVTAAELNKVYTREFCIDRIILEPVRK
jgi:hypothetical protein